MKRTRSVEEKTTWIWWVASEAIRERRIALPTHRIHWYCRWLYLKVTRKEVSAAMESGLQHGLFVKVKDGRRNYWKNAHR